MDTKGDTLKFKANLISKSFRLLKPIFYSFIIHIFALSLSLHLFQAHNSNDRFKTEKLIQIYLSSGTPQSIAQNEKTNAPNTALNLQKTKEIPAQNSPLSNLQDTTFSSSTNGISTATPILIHVEYPTASRRLGEEGEVLFKLNADNTRENISYSLIQSSGYQRLDQAASNGIENLLSRYFDQIENHFQNKNSKQIRFIFALNEKAYAIL